MFKKIFASFFRNEQWVFAVAAALSAMSVLGLAIVFINSATTVVPARGGDYAEGVVGQPSYVNPILASSDTDRLLVRLLFSNIKNIASKIEVDKTGRTWKVRLQEKLVWSDGEKLTSDDVYYAVKQIQNPETHSPLAESWQGVAVTRLSELELQFSLVNPYPFFADTIENLYVLPKHIYSSTPPANWRLSEYNLKPVTSGPYAFDRYEQKPNGYVVSYRLKSNPRFAGIRPFIERFELKFYEKNEDLVNAFNAGLIDGFMANGKDAVGRINRPYDTVFFVLPNYYAVFFNQNQNLALQDADVRRALSFAVDRAALINRVFGGQATPLTDPVVSLAPNRGVSAGANASSVPPGDFDPSAAARILENDGWKMQPGRFREKIIKNISLKLEVQLTVPQIPFLIETGTFLKQSWEAAGVRVTIIPMPTAPDEVEARAIKNRDYQALLFGNSANPPEDLYPFWHSNERFYPGLNLALYNNRTADQLLESVRRDGDSASRTKSLVTLKTVIHDDYPATFLYSPHYAYITSKSVRGVSGGFITRLSDRFGGIDRWHIKTTRTLK